MSASLTWVCFVAGWALVALGGWMALTGRGMSWKGKGRHCRRCGYDMGAISTLTCPECGRSVNDERELRRNLHLRRRWRVTGLVVLAVGWATHEAPAVAAHGWVGAAPSPLLACFGPTKLYESRQFAAVHALGVNPPAGPEYTWAKRCSDALVYEMWRRLYDGETSQWLGETYLQRTWGATGPELVDGARMPKEWAWDAEPPTAPSPAITPEDPFRVVTKIEPLSGPASAMRVSLCADFGRRWYKLRQVDLPIDAHLSAAQFMHRVSGGEVDREVLATAHPRVTLDSDDAWVEMHVRDEGLGTGELSAYASMKLVVLVRGTVVARGHWGVRFASSGMMDLAAVEWDPHGRELAHAEPDQIELELTGDPVAATQMYLEGYLKKRDAWAGTVRCKPEVIRIVR